MRDNTYFNLPHVNEYEKDDIRWSSFHRKWREYFDRAEFYSSVWFTRAWTLQELLAPPRNYFFNSDFVCIGSNNTLVEDLSKATGIPQSFLAEDNESDPSLAHPSVAEKMRWASFREATREEDTAYSLLGLFGVNMSLLYGEGSKAFLRLQTEIIRTMDDESIFAWSLSAKHGWTGLLAPNVKAFSTSKDIVSLKMEPRQHYEVTNKEINVNLALPNQDIDDGIITSKSSDVIVLLPLNCARVTNQFADLRIHPLGINIKLTLETPLAVGLFDGSIQLSPRPSPARYYLASRTARSHLSVAASISLIFFPSIRSPAQMVLRETTI